MNINNNVILFIKYSLRKTIAESIINLSKDQKEKNKTNYKNL